MKKRHLPKLIKSKPIKSWLIALFAFVFISLILNVNATFASERVYDLEVKKETMNMAGENIDFALTVNGGIPAPTLRFIEGEVAVINVTNSTNEETAVHWHGLLVPWNMDGVPFLNTKPIKPGETFTYRFPLRQSGTYWYHSHMHLQEQRGVYGAIVIEPKGNTIQVDHEIVMVLSDWINEHPQVVLARLKRDGHSYAWKKDTIPSIADAIAKDSLGAYLKNQWNRMDGMDFGDIGYDAFLINGKIENNNVLSNLSQGDKVRIRIINAGASSYFYVNLGKQHFKVISADGIDVQPVMTKEILMGMGETYDILFTAPNNEAFEFRATAQDITGYASAILGQGNIEYAPNKTKPNLYKMDMGDMDMGDMNMGDGHNGHNSGHDGHGSHNSGHGGHDGHSGHRGNHGDGINRMNGMNMPMNGPLKYSQLKAKTPTNFPNNTPEMEFKIVLGGDMERYVWWLNGKLLSEDTYIDIKQGHVIRFVIQNATMMHHPMHLHGHFFRLINGQGKSAPLKHTVDVSPMNTVTIEFLADEPGQWFFHCHNLYHFKSGMGRVIRYTNFQRPNEPKEAQKRLQHIIKNSSKFYTSAKIKAFTNKMAAAWDIRFNSGRYEVQVEGELTEDDIKKIENEIYVKHYFSNYFGAFGGLELRDQRVSPLGGISYVAPLYFELIGYATMDGDLVFKVEKTVQITKRLHIKGDVELRWQDRLRKHELEHSTTLNYNLNRNWSIGIKHENGGHIGEGDDKIGIGVTFKW